MTTTKLHRCRTCDGVAEWHYVLGSVHQPLTNRSAGENCWGPGQPTSTPQHALDPDFTNPFTLASLQTLRVSA